ncbi:hypothetical protein SAY87_018483 [Trapa incisa]|uniref:Vacuolar protein sorting-associated protein 13 VPS13 adaptor binding domain-containing protein n=1 Tax=Trapa incisa TaxID=236973 RepID=A0AAN7LBZ0_9MYRT|nr:hypothetical protein SAY87_018483 [Trapa incisa]
MFLDGFIRRRLFSFLSPWLRELPELELKVGIVRSHAIARNLQFDAAILNNLLGDSSNFIFKGLTVGEFSIRFSNWSVHSFTVDVRDVNVVLSAWTLESGGNRNMQKSKEMGLSSLDKKLSAMDPEGAALHEALRNFCSAKPSFSRIKATILNLICRHFLVEIHDIKLQLQFPIFDDGMTWMSEVKELNIFSEHLEQGCLLRDLMATSMTQIGNSSFLMNFNNFKIGFKRNDQITNILSCKDLLSYTKLNDLHVADLILKVPQLAISSSPEDVAVALLCQKILARKVHQHRNGRLLWYIAARKIRSMASAPRVTLYRSITNVILWLRYLHSYEGLLSLVGYPSSQKLKRSAFRVFEDKKFLGMVKHQLKVISDMEKELQPEAIVYARRIARYRISQEIHVKVISECRFTNHIKILGRIFALSICFIGAVLMYILSLDFLRILPLQKQETDGPSYGLSLESHLESKFILNVETVIITVSLKSKVNPSSSDNMELRSRVYPDVLFQVEIGALSLKYIDAIFEQSLLLLLESFSISSSVIRTGTARGSSSKSTAHHIRGYQYGKFTSLNKIIWTETLVNYLSATTDDHEDDNPDAFGSKSYLQKFLGEIWKTWKDTCHKSEESDTSLMNNCFIIFEFKSYLTCGPGSSTPGFLKCNLMVGKLNLSLGCSSTESIALLVREMNHAFCCSGHIDNFRSTHSEASYQSDSSWNSEYISCFGDIKETLLDTLPEKHIELGAFIAGPHLQISFPNDGLIIGKTTNYPQSYDFQLIVELHDIKIALWPTLESTPDDLTKWNKKRDSEPDNFMLEEHFKLDTAPGSDEKYSSQMLVLLSMYLRAGGLIAYMENLRMKQKLQIFALRPLTFQLSSFRKYTHSLGKATVALSANFYGIASGFAGQIFKDNIHILFQAALNLLSETIHYLETVPIGIVSLHESVLEYLDHADLNNVENTVEGSSFLDTATFFIIKGKLILGQMDITFWESKTSNSLGPLNTIFNAIRIGEHSMLDYGIGTTITEGSAELFFEDRKLEVLLDLSKMQLTIFGYGNKTRTTYYSPSETLELRSLHNLYETSFSNLTVALCWGSPRQGTVSSEVEGGLPINNLINEIENSSQRSSELNTSLDAMTSSLSQWLLINISVGEISLVQNSVKDVLHGAHEMNKLILSLSVGRKFQIISLEIQGGLIMIEMTSLAAFLGLYVSYIQRVQDLLHSIQSSYTSSGKTESASSMITVDGSANQDVVQEVANSPDRNGLEQMKAFTLKMSQFSLVFAAEEKSGLVREIMQEVDINLNFEVVNRRKRFLFDLLCLSVSSQVLHANDNHEVHVPYFSSPTSRGSSPSNSSGNLVVAHAQQETTDIIDNKSFLRDTPEDSSTIEVISTVHKKFILKHCRAFVHAYTVDNGPPGFAGALVGGGSVSGMDITISLSEIEMILLAVGSISRFSSMGTTNESLPRKLSNHHDIVYSHEEMIPNGAIIAIQDIEQHMYLAVDDRRDKYSLVGVIHYSLVGKRALFKVNYQNEGRLWSSNQWFSLISLHAKDESGQPYRLNYRRGSGFVEVSSNCDGRSSLFRAISCKHENFKGDFGWEAYGQLVKGTFYLLNKRSDCAVAFVNGIPEFVHKPGNPFKLKVFQETDLSSYSTSPISRPNEASSRVNLLQEDEHISEEISGKGRYFPIVDVKVEKMSLTIVQELLDEEEMFPLLQINIDNIQLAVQILYAKFRIFCTMTTWLDFFDSQGNSWRHLVNPVELYSFYRTRFPVNDTNMVKHGAPLYFYFRTKELDISLSEISLDILLFIIGKLDIAGPFSVRNTRIFPNHCKVENQSGANLLCHFYGNRNLKIAHGESVHLQLKHSVLADQSSDAPPAISIQLGFPGRYTTSPIHLSFLETQTFAWRTRILSLDDAKTYPGPVLVVDIGRKAEDGFSIVVSPLIRVHNETDLSMELRFQRPLQEKDEFALAVLKKGETLDDSMAIFGATSLSGGLKKAIMSITLGNFLFSFRPEIPEGFLNDSSSISVEWSDEIRGGKAVRFSGVLNQLSYRFRRVLSNESIKSSFSTASCTVNYDNSSMSILHFFIQNCTREVPIRLPDNANEQTPVALQEQQEIFLYPTVRVSNFIQSEINVLLTDSDQVTVNCCHSIGKQATISSGSAVNFYANPALIYFHVTLTAFNSSCKPLNSSNWMKNLSKSGKEISFLDMDLEFDGGKYFASLRLSRGQSGILEASVFTPYALKNKSGFPLYIYSANNKPPSRDEMRKLLDNISPDMGIYLPPDRTASWFVKSTKLRVHLLKDNIFEAKLDLNSLSGLSDARLEMDKGTKNKCFTKLGVAVSPAYSEIPVQLVTLVPRYVVVNNSGTDIMVRQCYLEDDMEGTVTIRTGEKVVLMLCDTVNRSEFSLFENFIRKHRNSNDDAVIFVQFQLGDSDFGWSGPVCVASLGRFFLKFRKQQPNQRTAISQKAAEFASVYVVQEGSSLVMHFHKPPSVKLPYRIENYLHDAIITYYQKDSSELEVLQPDSCDDYVWDDFTLPHKLVLHISDIHQLREINLDKVREWKPFFKFRRYEGLSSHFLSDKKLQNDQSKLGGLKELMNVGYEVYADGPTRVLRISEISDRQNVDKMFHSNGKIRLRIPYLAIHMIELKKVDETEPSGDSQILVSRFSHISMDILSADHKKYSQISVQSLNVMPRWTGAPFAAMLRRHHLHDDYPNDCIMQSVIILESTSSSVRQVKYLSIIIQPVDLNLDEESLMKLVPFWRSSLSESNTPSQQYYFDHFEIHPIKIFANFLPGGSYLNYSSAQETLRSFIHSVVKVKRLYDRIFAC